jgi:hypothetical protein
VLLRSGYKIISIANTLPIQGQGIGRRAHGQGDRHRYAGQVKLIMPVLLVGADGSLGIAVMDTAARHALGGLHQCLCSFQRWTLSSFRIE